MTDIESLLIQVENLRGQIDGLKIQQAIFISRFESEQGTEKRRHDGIDNELDKLNKKITDDIDKAEKQWNHIIFNRESGIAFLLDRLIEKDKKAEARKNQLIALWIVVLGVVLKILYDLIAK